MSSENKPRSQFRGLKAKLQYLRWNQVGIIPPSPIAS
jgi:hypothetical protein